MTLLLLTLNLVVFWYELALGRQFGPFLERWGLVPAELTAILDGGSGQVGVLVTPLSAMFVHAGWLHLLRNLVYLWFFGRLVEPTLGRAQLALVYVLTGYAAGLVQVAATPQSTEPAVGASGAVAGLVGGYLMLLLWRVPSPARGRPAALWRHGTTVLLGLWLAALVLGGVLEAAQMGQSGASSWWGHFGGFTAGIILVSLSRYTRHAFPIARRRWLSSN